MYLREDTGRREARREREVRSLPLRERKVEMGNGKRN
jgi:hypothetical protein